MIVGFNWFFNLFKICNRIITNLIINFYILYQFIFNLTKLIFKIYRWSQFWSSKLSLFSFASLTATTIVAPFCYNNAAKPVVLYKIVTKLMVNRDLRWLCQDWLVGKTSLIISLLLKKWSNRWKPIKVISVGWLLKLTWRKSMINLDEISGKFSLWCWYSNWYGLHYHALCLYCQYAYLVEWMPNW